MCYSFLFGCVCIHITQILHSIYVVYYRLANKAALETVIDRLVNTVFRDAPLHTQLLEMLRQVSRLRCVSSVCALQVRFNRSPRNGFA